MIEFHTLAATDTAFTVLFGGAMLIGLVAVVVDAIRKVASVRAREASRREIAAYVAEGSMTADDGAKLLAAGGTLKDKIGLK